MKASTHLEAIRRSVNVMMLISIFVTCYFARDLILPVLLGFLIALTLSPLSRGMARLGVPHWVSGVGLISIVAVLIALIVFFGAGTVGNWMSSADQMAAELQYKMGDLFRQLESVREAGENVADMADGDDDPGTQEVVVQQPTMLNSAFDALGTLGTTVAVSLVLAVFLLSSGNLFYIKLVQSFETMSGKKRALQMVYDIERQVSNYLLTIALINAGLGLTIGIALTLLGLPYGWIWGIVAFLFNFLPYLGAVAGVVLVGAFSIITFDDIGFALLSPLIYFTCTTIEGNFVTPSLLGRSLKMNTVAVFLTVVLWAWLWGIPGALVAVPFLVVFKVVAENIDSLSIVSNFLSGSTEKSEMRELRQAPAAFDDTGSVADD
ncbi:AI-2E family transporter [Loktanella sp. SALINAS62]|uniref:AI-2E family transporter n=1 Tax=Loktanella sp. SALINAS62 TaxID=2706124 RepID=UPI001B8D77A8|nr:AI-2E family transporter [Loktanella sp. SALINAS62]MBS1301555.1 AI-2E family transporter [Loktanella sp. SALINAS62]